jgi:hypothetical protein
MILFWNFSPLATGKEFATDSQLYESITNYCYSNIRRAYELFSLTIYLFICNSYNHLINSIYIYISDRYPLTMEF